MLITQYFAQTAKIHNRNFIASCDGNI